MAEYIEREATLNTLRNLGSRDYRREKGTIADAIKMIMHPHYTPTADVVEVRHGEWIKPTPYSQEYCNQCGLTPKTIFGVLPNYCPNCGAKMDGKEGKR